MLLEPAAVRYVARRVDNDRLQPIKVIGLVEPERHYAGISGDRDHHFVGQLEAASADPILFGNHDLDKTFQPLAPLFIQIPEMPHALL